MDSKKIKLKILEILKIILKIDKKKNIESISVDNFDKWDSLKHITIIMALEEEFEIKFTNDEITDSKSFNDIFKIITKKMK